MALYSYGPIWVWRYTVTAYIVVALYSYGPIQSSPYTVVAYAAMASVVMAL